MKPQFRSILIGGALALGLGGCRNMDMSQTGSAGTANASWGGLVGPSNGLAEMNSDASGWGITPAPGSAGIFKTRRTSGASGTTGTAGTSNDAAR